MTPLQAQASYRRKLGRDGKDIEIRRYAGTGQARAIASKAIARGRALGMGSHALAGETVQGTRKVILFVDPAAAVPSGYVALSSLLPLTVSDKIFINGRELAIFDVDDDTARVGDTLIALNIMTRG